jgi:hypothetical protein
MQKMEVEQSVAREDKCDDRGEESYELDENVPDAFDLVLGDTIHFKRALEKCKDK